MNPSERALLDALHSLSSHEFERQVAHLLEAEAYRDVRVQGGSNDRGVDIVCLDNEGRFVAVQCKRFAPTATVSALVVQHLVGMAVKRKAHRAMLVTTGSFTGPARTQAKDFDIELIDGARLASMVAVHPGLVAALGVGDVRPVQVRAEDQPRPFVPIAAARPPAPKETFKDGSWFDRLVFRFPALTEENMAAVMEWGMTTLCPPAGEGCFDFPLTRRQAWNNCGWLGRCWIGSINNYSGGVYKSWDVWMDGRSGKGRLTQKGRPDIT